jgi:dipeptidyl aminopeptidase/acylaminoacyl peptidase
MSLRALLRSRSALLADLDPWSVPGGEERLLVRSDLAGTMQLHEYEAGELHALTELPEPVGAARYLPGRRAVLEIDAGGNERHALHLIELEAARTAPARSLDALQALTDAPTAGHHVAGISADGTRIAYTSNRANGVDFDLWLLDLGTGEHILLHAAGGWLQPGSGFSPDGRFVSVRKPGERPLDEDLLLVEIATGEATTILPHPAEAALVGAPAWTSADAFYVTANVASEFQALFRHDLGTGETTRVLGVGEDCDADVMTSRDGSTTLVCENRDGGTSMRLLEGRVLSLPEPGVAAWWAFGLPRLSPDGTRAYFTLSTPRLPGDVFCAETRTGRVARLTRSPVEVPPAALASPESVRVTSFDGEQLPLFLFRPASAPERPPVVLVVHGGPEAQAMLTFNPVVQGLVRAGYGVIVPNVRGSTGYGKRYASLDDTTRRLDSVRDLAAIHGHLGALGFDGARAALWGGSYGGYMVLAGLAFHPELWAAGVDIVGISDLVTFLQNTSDYRRAHREREYGSLAHDREFLASASPLRRIDQIRAPLFVIHGRNDPRVPVSEAEQLVGSLRHRGIRCELAVYEDEGHGLARLENRLDAYPRAVAFLDDLLRPAG